VDPGRFDESAFFAAVARSGARALLIGRQALIVLGIPVITSDYDFWVHADDAAVFNEAAARFGLVPSCSPEEARSRGRYVLENSEHVDVLVARRVATVTGEWVVFDEIWERRDYAELGPDAVALPCIADLIATKRFAARPKDAEDIRLLSVLVEERAR
jgi:hypothetical protein